MARFAAILVLRATRPAIGSADQQASGASERLSTFRLRLRAVFMKTAEALRTEAGRLSGLMLCSLFLEMAWHSSGAMASRERCRFFPRPR
jgi:hypothetical protein